MGQRGPAGLLDELKKSEICAILASGGSQADAAGYVGCSLDSAPLNSEISNSEMLDSEILNSEILDSELSADGLTSARSASLWQMAAAAVLLVAALLWGSFAQPMEPAFVGLERSTYDNLERFPPSVSRLAFKVSPVESETTRRRRTSCSHSPEGTAPCQPRPTAWGNGPDKVQ